MGNNKIACVIVTYNRLDLLKLCIEALRNQAIKEFDIVVVNNDSTDGTKEWLSSQNDLILINQGNLGGAGGFYTGTKYAYENGYEWIWMMDDDGLPEKNQLKELLTGAARTNSYFLNALVCNVNDKEKLAFGIALDGMPIWTVKDAQVYPEVHTYINPFNGTFINRAVIEKIGFVKKEMFVWGDEFDYVFRARRAGFKMYTITSALHYHPASRANYGNVIPFISKFKILLPPKKRREIKYRNIGYLHSKYYKINTIIKMVLLYSIYYLLRLNFIGFCSFVKGYIRGFKNNFSK